MIELRMKVNKYLAEIINLDYRIIAVVSEAGQVLGIIELQNNKYFDIKECSSDISCIGRQAIKQFKRGLT